jgi:hypothetical protein
VRGGATVTMNTSTREREPIAHNYRAERWHCQDLVRFRLMGAGSWATRHA